MKRVSKPYSRQCVAILRWWDVHGRTDLPWQGLDDPYMALVAEVMLQQTGVGTVLRYYSGFLSRFPTVGDLALADIDQVLSIWQGLGYYARARNLHKACRAVVADGGRWPVDARGWCALPGVGRSTANALVASLTDRPHAILDGNVKRVLARVFAVSEPVQRPATLARLWQLAEQFLPARRGRDFAQAMMDLGALVCKRTRPQCPQCPLQRDCLASRQALTDTIPNTTRTTTRSQESYWLLFIRRRNGSCLFGARPPRGIWGGLWTPPMPSKAVPLSNLGQWLRQNLGLDGTPLRTGTPFVHELTHKRLTLHPIEIKPTPIPGTKRLPPRLQSNSKNNHAATNTKTKPSKATTDDIEYGWHLPHELPGGMPAPVLELTKQLRTHPDTPTQSENVFRHLV
ncbi:MAG: A/G-specific adenine glycosylase [Gammaproteobacteria bacterium]|nr:A/G-specific adenine glycosylase [Gammaproteobacteria bacterium]